MRELVIWAHSECRSTMALFREVKRVAGVPVTIALWKSGKADDVRKVVCQKRFRLRRRIL